MKGLPIICGWVACNGLFKSLNFLPFCGPYPPPIIFSSYTSSPFFMRSTPWFLFTSLYFPSFPFYFSSSWLPLSLWGSRSIPLRLFSATDHLRIVYTGPQPINWIIILKKKCTLIMFITLILNFSLKYKPKWSKLLFFTTKQHFSLNIHRIGNWW
jgi:hypothetical protein